ncbi:MAG: tyrosine-type recombinase/integrase [Pseudomonadota bacterium]
MTQERITPNHEVLPAFYRQLQTHPLYIDMTYDLESATPPRSNLKPQHLFPRHDRWHRECRRGLELGLKRLSEKELAGKDHIEAYLRDQYRRNLRPSTLANSLMSIESFMFFIQKGGKVRLEEITRRDIEGWIEHEQDRGMKASTVDMRLGTLKAFLRFLIEREVLRHDLLSKKMSVKVPDALPRAMDPDDVRQLLTVLKDVRDRAMILILLRTGMRVGELLNTIMEDVNLKERRIEIYEAGKTRVGRVVYLSDDALKALRAWLKVREPHKTYLFYSQGKHRHSISYPGVRAIFVKCLEKAGLSHKGYTLHCLRHTCASELLNAGMRLESVQQLLGHSTIEMTRRYARLTDRTREEEYFRAMAIIERGEINGHYQLDRELSAFLEKTQLLSSHDQELHEHT